MNNACAALKNNSIRCSYCAKTVLTVIGNLSVNSSYSMLLTRFDSEESFIDHCVEEVYSGYVVKAAKHGENRLFSLKMDFLDFLNRCKTLAINMHKKRLTDEHYFSDELHRSFNEFMSIIISTLGYLPLRLQFMGEE
jgi:copper chaperone CopZ